MLTCKLYVSATRDGKSRRISTVIFLLPNHMSSAYHVIVIYHVMYRVITLKVVVSEDSLG